MASLDICRDVAVTGKKLKIDGLGVNNGGEYVGNTEEVLAIFVGFCVTLRDVATTGYLLRFVHPVKYQVPCWAFSLGAVA